MPRQCLEKQVAKQNPRQVVNEFSADFRVGLVFTDLSVCISGSK